MLNNNNNNKCQCDENGYCSIRGITLSPLHQRLCAEGKGEVVDRILAKVKEQRDQSEKKYREIPKTIKTKRNVPLVGDELEKILNSFGKIKTENASCSCKTLRDEMNRKGAEWCRENLENKILPALLKNIEIIRKDIKSQDLGVKVMLTGAALLPDAVLKYKLRSYVETAITNAISNLPVRTGQGNRNGGNRQYKQPVELMPPEWEPVKHLIFHIYPVSDRSDLWKWHLDWLIKHKDLFNGRRIIGISVDSNTANAKEVMDYLGDGFEFRVNDNIPRDQGACCENVTFFDSLETLSDGVCFYAHAKGVTSAKVSDKIARKWSKEMYSHLLGEYSSGMLRHNGAYGTFLTDYYNTAVISGTFFWFRVKEAKERHWRTGNLYHSVELWPTLIFQDKMECFAKYDLRGKANIQSLQKSETWDLLEKQWGDQKQYADELHQAIKDAQNSEYPEGRYSGRGIIMPAGGWWKLRKPHQPYFWCAYTATSFLRHKGCGLPVQWWFLPGEIDEIGRDLVTKWANRVGATLHETDDSVKGGWQIKIYAILHSDFEEVIHLDSDVIVVDNPEKLFDEQGYIDTGIHFWCDNPNLVGKFEKCSYVLPSMWDRMNLPRRDKIRDIEAGQMVIDKRRAWKALLVDKHFASNAEYWEGFNGGGEGVWYGDKTSHHIACLVTDTPHYKDTRFHFVHSQGWYGHKTSDGKIALQHCCHRKGDMVDGRVIPGISEAEGVASFGRLRKQQTEKGSHVGDYTFVHIPKTGGTSLRGSLIAAGMPIWRGEHFYWDDRPDQHLNLSVITILRHPVDRIISHYNDMMYKWHTKGRIELDWPHDITLEEFRKMSLVEFAEYNANGVSANLQTLYLGPTLELAKAHLDECAFVFNTETLNTDIKKLEDKISRQLFIQTTNKRPNNGLTRNQVPQKDIDKIIHLASDDLKLYIHSKTVKMK